MWGAPTLFEPGKYFPSSLSLPHTKSTTERANAHHTLVLLSIAYPLIVTGKFFIVCHSPRHYYRPLPSPSRMMSYIEKPSITNRKSRLRRPSSSPGLVMPLCVSGACAPPVSPMAPWLRLELLCPYSCTAMCGFRRRCDARRGWGLLGRRGFVVLIIWVSEVFEISYLWSFLYADLGMIIRLTSHRQIW